MGAIAVGHLGVFLEDVIMDRATSIQCGWDGEGGGGI